ncbi:MAG TPA: hypothetical protein P5277_00935 [Candidatus Paceibacterota bacterium]|nr:hypothetical protein [Candidatus Paceibacterota bacterium]
MINIVKNRYLDSLLKLFLLSAIIHVILILIYTLISGDYQTINFFNILDIDLFIPLIKSSNLIFIIASITMIAIYLIIFLLFSKNKK